MIPDAMVDGTAAGAARPPVQLQMAVGVELGQTVRIAGKRGSYRVVGFRPGGVQLIDEDQKWHVVRPEAVRAMPAPKARPARRP
jgi:hypothetical protein